MAEKTGVELIAEERKRQIEVKGYTAESDERYPVRHFVGAATAYLTGTIGFWPWHRDGFHFDESANRVFYVKQNLVKAGALIAAAIDRMERD